ncbi:MAG: TolC family protein [Planctomycetota bacterium]
MTDSKRTGPEGRRYLRLVTGLTVAVAVVGCRTSQPVLKYLGRTKPAVTKTDQLDVAYPVGADVDSTVPLTSDEPRTIVRRDRDEIWDLPLEEAIETALRNSDVIRTSTGGRGQVTGFGLTGSSINAATTSTIYDPAVQASNAFGQRGVEAALSDFDANFTSSITWGKNERILNNAIFAGVIGGTAVELGEETAVFDATFSKNLATGGVFSVGQDWNYDANNAFPAGQLFPSTYTGAFSVNARQPLLAGGGVEYTRIAGPIGTQVSAAVPVNNGVVIARINEDISIAAFEINTRNLVKSVEDSYWNLYLAYRNYETSLNVRDSALRSWREAKAKLDIGGTKGFRPADEAQARDFYFETRAAAENALSSLYTNEAELRRLMGLQVNDGRVIRPIDEPTTAEFTPDWESSITEGLMFRSELRQTKWDLKSLQLQLRAARNLLKPRLDAVAGYQVNGFGDHLIDYDDGAGLDSAYGTLLENEQTGWSLGLELSVPIGHRAAKSQVRNIELQIVQTQKQLEAAELDLTHEIADAVQQIAVQYRTATTNFNRRVAAKRRLELFQEEFRASTVTLDEVLRAQSSLAQAENAYFSSLVGYNQAVTQLQFAKGTLLDWNDISLAESPWTPAGYRHALRRAWERGHAIPNPMLRDSIEPFAIPDDSRRLVTPVSATTAAPAELELAPLPTLPDGDAPIENAPTPADPTPADPPPAAPPVETADVSSPAVAFPPAPVSVATAQAVADTDRDASTTSPADPAPTRTPRSPLLSELDRLNAELAAIPSAGPSRTVVPVSVTADPRPVTHVVPAAAATDARPTRPSQWAGVPSSTTPPRADENAARWEPR